MVKKYSQFAGVLVAVALLASIASGQQTRVYRDGDSWTEPVGWAVTTSESGIP